MVSTEDYSSLMTSLSSLLVLEQTSLAGEKLTGMCNAVYRVRQQKPDAKQECSSN